jgi:hypothetical protein
MMELDHFNAEIWGTDPANPEELSDDPDGVELDIAVKNLVQRADLPQLTMDGTK